MDWLWILAYALGTLAFFGLAVGYGAMMIFLCSGGEIGGSGRL